MKFVFILLFLCSKSFAEQIIFLDQKKYEDYRIECSNAEEKYEQNLKNLIMTKAYFKKFKKTDRSCQIMEIGNEESVKSCLGSFISAYWPKNKETGESFKELNDYMGGIDKFRYCAFEKANKTLIPEVLKPFINKKLKCYYSNKSEGEVTVPPTAVNMLVQMEHEFTFSSYILSFTMLDSKGEIPDGDSYNDFKFTRGMSFYPHFVEHSKGQNGENIYTDTRLPYIKSASCSDGLQRDTAYILTIAAQEITIEEKWKCRKFLFFKRDYFEKATCHL